MKEFEPLRLFRRSQMNRGKPLPLLRETLPIRGKRLARSRLQRANRLEMQRKERETPAKSRPRLAKKAEQEVIRAGALVELCGAGRKERVALAK